MAQCMLGAGSSQRMVKYTKQHPLWEAGDMLQAGSPSTAYCVAVLGDTKGSHNNSGSSQVITWSYLRETL